MPKQKIDNLMSELHDLFGAVEPSAEQKQLLEQLQNNIHDINTQEPVSPTPLESIEVLIEQMEAEHPKTIAVLNELLNTLKNIGV